MMGGAAHDGRLFGDLLACGMALCMSVMMLIVRRHSDTPMVPAACLSAFLCPLLVWPVAAPLQVGGMDALWLLLFGTMQFGLGLVFLTLGGRLISATEAALINTLETPLAVVWVWVAFSEIPTMASAVGGAIVMVAVAGHVWRSSQTRLAYAD
jgi:drug/metabolite transporter (DMT)-like permease